MSSLEQINKKIQNNVLELIEVDCSNHAQHLVKMIKIDSSITELMSFMVNHVYNDIQNLSKADFDEIHNSLKIMKKGITTKIKE